MPASKATTPTRRRTPEQALAAAEAVDPIALRRLIVVQEQLDETMETMQAQSRRRDEAVYLLAEAGVSYSDIARIIGVTPERARQLTARHLGIDVGELNPTTKKATNRH